MCMIAVDDGLIKDAIATKMIDENYTEETLSKMFEKLLSERIKQNLRPTESPFLKYCGVLDDGDAKIMMEAINDCRRIEPNEW